MLSNSQAFMKFDLDPMIEEMREMVVRWAADRLAPRAAEIDETNEFPRDLWPELGELGLLGITVSEEDGGAGLGYVAHCVVMEEISRASGAVGLSYGAHSNLCVNQLKLNANKAQKEKYLPKLISGEHLGALAMSEPGAGSDVVGMRTRAEKKGDRYILNGNKMWITNGLSARWFVTLVQTGELNDKRTLAMVLIDGAAPGVERLKISGKMGLRPSETASLHLSDYHCPAVHVLGPPGNGLKLALLTLNGGRITIAAQATGIAEACLDEMVRYAKERHQFSRPIADFPAIRNMIADSVVDLAAAKQLIAQACSIDDRNSAFIAAAAKAKLFASEAAQRIADRAVQVHGGAGYVNDSPIEQYFRDVRVTRIYEGTSEIQRIVIARELRNHGVID